jgi:hypothetical protein
MKRSLLRSLSAIFPRRKDQDDKEKDEKADIPRIDTVSDTPPSEDLHTDDGGLDKDWLYVGSDEEGTPIFLDKTRLVYGPGSISVQVWLKHLPAEASASFEQAEKYLKETGHNSKAFHHIEQLIELDLRRDLIADLVLRFFDRSDGLVEEMQFQERTFRPLGTETTYGTIKEMVNRLNDQPGQSPEPPPREEPTIDEKIELKLQEIGSAFEAFDMDDGSDNADDAKPSKPKRSR